MFPVWIMGSNIDTTNPSMSSAQTLEKEHNKEKEKLEATLLSKKKTDKFSKINENIRGLVRGFTSLFKDGINLLTGNTTVNAGENNNNNANMNNGGLKKGQSIEIPSSVKQSGIIADFTNYNYWYSRWTKGTGQRKVADTWGKKGKPSSNGIATIDDYYVIATTEKFGKAGDILSVVLEDGQSFNAILGDAKSYHDKTSTQWGHQKSTGISIVEFEAIGNTNTNDGVKDINLGSWKNKKVAKIINAGSYFDNPNPEELNGEEPKKNNNSKNKKGKSKNKSKSKENNIVKLFFPTANAVGRVSSHFGDTDGRPSGHTGLDYAVPSNTKVYATLGGTVEIANFSSSAGNWVVINHGNGMKTKYMHNTSLKTKAGDKVKKGQLIAYSGSTGQSTGPHVHFQIEVNGKPVDPETYAYENAPSNVGQGSKTGSGSNEVSSDSTNNSSSATPSGNSGSISFNGVFDSKFAVSVEEQMHEEAEKYFEKKAKKNKGFLFKADANKIKKGSSGNLKTSNAKDMNSWKDSYNNNVNELKAQSTKNADNIKNVYEKEDKSKQPSVKPTDTKSASDYSKFINEKKDKQPEIVYNAPDEKNTKSIEEISKNFNKTTINIPKKDTITNNSNKDNVNINNKNSAINSVYNNTCCFDKEKFDLMIDELNLINDYTGEIVETNNILTKVRDVIKNKKSLKSKENNNKSNINDFSFNEDDFFSSNKNKMAMG